MGKANISFPEGMLEDVDRRATESGVTRSAFIQEATARYIAQLDFDVEREARRARIQRAAEGMRRIGETLPPGPDGVTLIRQMRDEVPAWLTPRSDSSDD